MCEWERHRLTGKARPRLLVVDIGLLNSMPRFVGVGSLDVPADCNEPTIDFYKRFANREDGKTAISTSLALRCYGSFSLGRLANEALH